jgi:DNA phosphorothioation-dependent restriction protein DptG
MRKIELLTEGKAGLKGRLLKTNAFQHHTGYQINVFPFKTQPGGHVFKADFQSFQGIIGEVFRLLDNKDINKPKSLESYKTVLKNSIIKNAVNKVQPKDLYDFEDILTNIYFDSDSSLFKFDFNVISYMNYINNNNAIKDIPLFITDVLLKDKKELKDLLAKKENENILNQLISECLPDLVERKETKREKQPYKNMLFHVTEIFQQDFEFLMLNKEYFLENIETFFKFYYFFYFTQLTFKLELFGQERYQIRPIFFSMDWENLSESRLSLHKTSWKHIVKRCETVFAHANTLELMNYILVDQHTIGDYEELTNLYNTFEPEEKEQFKNCLEELITFYKEEVKTLNSPANWEDCQAQLELALEGKKYDQEITKLIFSLHYTIRYQFENGKRNKPYNDYSLWLSSFCKENFTKSGGRLGPKMVLSQEILLFLTKICVGENEKIRLKVFWEKLQERGIAFDETSKLEIIKLFERINLIEKKSDSGDAQYIKSTL